MLSIESVYKYVSKDYSQKLVFCLIVALVMFIPVFGQLLIAGLSVKIVSNIINKKDEIPKVFGSIKEDLMLGLKLILFSIIIMIPFFILMGSSFFMLMGSLLIPSTENFSSIINFVLPLLFLGIIYSLIIPPLVANFAKKKKFGAFFEIGPAFNAVFSKFGLYLKKIGIDIFYAFVLVLISSALSFTIIVPFLLSPLSMLISGKILGEWYNEAFKK